MTDRGRSSDKAAVGTARRGSYTDYGCLYFAVVFDPLLIAGNLHVVVGEVAFGWSMVGFAQDKKSHLDRKLPQL